MDRAIRRSGLLAIVLALCCAATVRAPHLHLTTPWIALAPSRPHDDQTPIEEWALSNGLPGEHAAGSTQYVQLSTLRLEEGGLGGFIGQRIAWMTGAREIRKLSYAKIDECLRAAWLFTFDEDYQGAPRSYELVFFAEGETLYQVDYSRPLDQALNADAHAAIVDLCNYRAAKP